VVHRTQDAARLVGPASTVQVKVRAALPAVASGALQLNRPNVDEHAVAVTTDLGCRERRNLKARLRLERAGGGLVAEQLVDVPGTWRYPVEGGCNGGDFLLSGQLFDATTGEQGGKAQLEVKTPRLETRLDALASPVLAARCGEGARGTLTQMLPPDACQAVSLGWQQVGGPALVEAALSGTQVAVATRETGLDALVGQAVVLRVTADAGAGNAATREHTVPITVDPFIEVLHRTETPNGAESGLVGVAVELRNTTACGVSEVQLDERLEGLSYVPGSARFGGQPVEVEADGERLRVRGLTLPGEGTGRLTYVARPRLLARPRLEAQVFLREVPIASAVQPPEPPAGCGCASGDSGSVAFGLGVLAALARRRRRGTAA
jgi:MYXO-CTERM domain-containing protein